MFVSSVNVLKLKLESRQRAYTDALEDSPSMSFPSNDRCFRFIFFKPGPVG